MDQQRDQPIIPAFVAHPSLVNTGEHLIRRAVAPDEARKRYALSIQAASEDLVAKQKAEEEAAREFEAARVRLEEATRAREVAQARLFAREHRRPPDWAV